jgi:EAL domain-containing protein (putative c-di-GMP-specific phosphodiesterase class I)
VQSLERLRQLGIRVGIDDFGTGYSSLGHLQRLPLDFIKIDRSFIRRLPDSRQARTTVEAITTVAHAHHLTVTAEGVETALQLQAVKEIGCDHVQGFLAGRPAPRPQ